MGNPPRLLRSLKTWLTTILAPAEDPRQTFASNERRWQAQLSQTRAALTDLTAATATMERALAAARFEAARLQHQAQDALVMGREDNARAALRRRQALIEQMTLVEEERDQFRHETARLAILEQDLALRIEELASRRAMLSAHHDAETVLRQLADAVQHDLPRLDEFDQALERAGEETRWLRARVEAVDRLVTIGVLDGGGPLAAPPLPHPPAPAGLPADAAERLDDLPHRVRLDPSPGEAAQTEAVPRPDAALTAGLTPRELEVLRLLEGRSDREMAELLFLSPSTVRTHVENIKGKLGVSSRSAAVGWAHRRGLAAPDPPPVDDEPRGPAPPPPRRPNP